MARLIYWYIGSRFATNSIKCHKTVTNVKATSSNVLIRQPSVQIPKILISKYTKKKRRERENFHLKDD